jgi:hypothetical protein
MVVAGGFDLIGAESNGFGLQQVSVLVAGMIVTLAGARRLVYPGRATWDGVLLILYLAGILLMGLKPSQLHGSAGGLLEVAVFSRLDFGINVFGFVPLSYLLMSCFDAARDRRSRTGMVVLVFCLGLGISLGLEVTQHSIPGRYSSLHDVLANTLGTLMGVTLYISGRVWATQKERAQTGGY